MGGSIGKMSDCVSNFHELQHLHALKNELSFLKKQISAMQDEIKKAEDAVYLKCTHSWVIDCSNVGEHTEHVCTICGLSKRSR
jgi:hypothetical protein